MRRGSTNPKVLLCTAYRRFPSDYSDVVGFTVYGLPRIASPRKVSMGLRFIKQNVPEVEILEYPLWHEYVAKLKEGWDVVGFSLFQNDIGEGIRMAEEARRQGIKELWAGGYGALDPILPSVVDRVFIGAAEDYVAQVFGKRVDEVMHPLMTWPMIFEPGNIKFMQVGLLYTRRGCSFRCKFCQTPAFEKKPVTITLESIKRALEYYRKIGLSELFVADELFGSDPRHAEKLTELFARYGFKWWAQTRASLFLKYLDPWFERGLRFPMIGLESSFPKALNVIDKHQKVDDVVEYARRTREKPGMYRIVDCIFGYENMTLEETLQDARTIKSMGFEAYGVSILTPFPGTTLWKELSERYGIFEKDYRRYDLGYMVWNHPNISPLQMRYLRATLVSYLNNPMDAYIKGFTRLIWGRLRTTGLDFVWRELIKGPVAAMLYDDRKQVFLNQSVHKSITS